MKFSINLNSPSSSPPWYLHLPLPFLFFFQTLFGKKTVNFLISHCSWAPPKRLVQPFILCAVSSISLLSACLSLARPVYGLHLNVLRWTCPTFLLSISVCLPPLLCHSFSLQCMPCPPGKDWLCFGLSGTCHSFMKKLVRCKALRWEGDGFSSTCVSRKHPNTGALSGLPSQRGHSYTSQKA